MTEPVRMMRIADLMLRPTKGALDNAREATMSLALAIADRLVITGDADEADDEPGTLHKMSRTECHELLEAESVARFAYVARAGVPDIVPVNYLLDGDDVLIRSGPGPKLQAAERREVVAVQVDTIDRTDHTARSVVVTGRAERLSADEARALEDRLADTPWAAGPRRHVIRVVPTRVAGRRLS
jgi:nitroimidazol reductase NimA-like FMN-containing flavoprotein (pyridoxamine 5'-phosphate oxidase superfamily)